MSEMKALVFHGPQDLRYESVPRPVPGRNEVLVRVKSVSICGSDLSGYRGGNPMRVPPLIMGHEFSGEIAECGEGADKFKPKDRVGVITNLYCGTCSNCRQGLQNVCENRFIIGTTMKAGSYNGAMAEYVLAPAEKIVPLPDHVSFNEAALAEPLSIALRATKHAGNMKGKSVGVFGAGPIGQLAIACMKHAGAERIVAVDLVDKRLEMAESMGASHTINAGNDVISEIEKLTEGIGLDCVFDAAGVEATINTGIEVVRNGGTVLLVGMASPKINIELKHAIAKEIKFLTSYMYTSEMKEGLDLIAEGKIDVKKIITAEYPLSEGPRIFSELFSGNSRDIKVILKNS